MASSPAEFRAKVIKTVTLPSGLSVEIKKIRLKDFLGLGEIPLPVVNNEEGDQPVAPTSDTEESEYKVENLKLIDRYGKHAITMAAINPRFSEKPEDLDNPDVVHLSLLTDEDLYSLITEILTWSGLNKEAGQTAESFRADRVGENGGRPRAEIREAAD
jgi:hypothetical protein